MWTNAKGPSSSYALNGLREGSFERRQRFDQDDGD
jgi:hypothetical protein